MMWSVGKRKSVLSVETIVNCLICRGRGSNPEHPIIFLEKRLLDKKKG